MASIVLRAPVWSIALGAALVLAAGCDDDETTGGTGGSGAAATGGSAGFEPLGGNGQGGYEGCMTAEIAGERKVLVLLIAMDRSGSMGPIWHVITTSLESFFGAPSSKGISAGFNFFAPPGQADGCDASAYNPPQYPVGPLPSHSSTLTQVLTGMQLGGETPTYPALEGSLAWAVTYQQAHPELDVVVALASDGDPTTCDTDPDNIAALAADALATAGVRTFAVAISGATLANLDKIAAAGGTGQALDVTSDASAIEQKMTEIREVTVACDLVIPEPDPSDPFVPTQLNVNLDPDGSDGSQPASAVPQVPSESDCGNEPGWYYDDPDDPTKVFLCPATCELLKSPNGAVTFTFGCPTIVK
jgi:hypothetical protein